MYLVKTPWRELLAGALIGAGLSVCSIVTGCDASEAKATRHVDVVSTSFVDLPDGAERIDEIVDSYDEPATDDGLPPSGFTQDGDTATDTYGDVGQAEQAVVLNSLYGFIGQAGGVTLFNPCVFPNTQQTPCVVPSDKTVQYGWRPGFPTTNSNMPGIDFDERLHAAIDELKTLPFLSGWSINYIAGKGETMQLSSNTMGALGLTPIEYNFPGSIHNSAGTQWFTRSLARCNTLLNPTVMKTSWGTKTLEQQKAEVKSMLEHEIGHCLGFSDFNFSGSQQFLMYFQDQAFPFTFTSAEQNSLSFFQP